MNPATTEVASVSKGAPARPVQPGSRRSDRRRTTRRAEVRSDGGRSLLVAILALAAIAVHLILRFGFRTSPLVYNVLLFVALAFGGLPLLIDLIRKVFAREFGSDLLAGISIVAAVLQGEYLVGTIVVLMLSGGTALEEMASRRASSVLDELAKRQPQTAHRKQEGGIVDVALDDVRVGDILEIFPHEICPADGVVVDGQGMMNEAFLTGEPFEMQKAPGSQLISGALNGDAAIVMRTERLPVDSRYARIMRVMEETQQQRPRLRRLGDKLGAWYTPIAVGLAVLAWVFTRNPHRFLAVVVIATPCPLLIAIPVAVIGAISLAARRGIIVKNPAVLEQIETCRTFIFDKTGTLTYGRPTLTEVECSPQFQEKDVVRFAASLERYSKHPLAQAILDYAAKNKVQAESASEIQEQPGRGLRGTIGGRKVLLTGRDRLGEEVRELPGARSGLECVLFVDGQYAALFRFRDAPRQDSDVFVKHLGPRHKVNRILLVSGDRLEEVRYLAAEVGISEIHAAKSPEEKVAIVHEETQRARTLFVGDGINDAPAMQAASVAVAFGHDSEITAEAADAVILESSLGKVDELIHIGQRMRSIALQSAIGGMALSIIGMLAASAGYLNPIGGAIAQEIIDTAAVLNAVRMALPFKNLRDF
jgi:heavy metal translocating P-type ATPase